MRGAGGSPGSLCYLSDEGVILERSPRHRTEQPLHVGEKICRKPLSVG